MQIMKNDGTMNIAPGGWLAPYSITAASSNGEKLKSFEIKFNGINVGEIKEVTVFSNKSQFVKSLVHFPSDWAKQKSCLKKDKTGIANVVLKTPVVLPAKLKARKDFIIGFKLVSKSKCKNFTVSLGQFVFSNSQITPAETPVTCHIDKTPPTATVSSENIKYSNGVTGINLKVTTDSKLAYPPHISIEYAWGKNIKNHHTYPKYRYSTPMKKTSANNYILPVLFLERLSDNLAKDKKITYTCSPQPDSWKWRKDNTGHDLIDGDARIGFVASPGGMRWLYTKSVDLVVDLKSPATIGEVVLYTCSSPKEINVWTSHANNGPWTKFGNQKINSLPYKQYGPPHSPMRASIVCSQMPEARFLKVEIKCMNSLIVSELAVYGTRGKNNPLKPKSVKVHISDETGNITTKICKIP